MNEGTFLDHLSEPESSALTTPAIDPQKTVDQKLNCPRCGRDLQSLRVIDRCPGCGRLISRSLYDDALQFCDPIWIKELVRGSKLILKSIIAFVICVPLALVGAVIIHFAIGIERTDYRLLLPITLFMLVPHLIMLCGAWRITTPDPDRLDLESKITSRSIARLGIFISLAAMPLMIVEGFQVEAGVMKPSSMAIFSVEITTLTLWTLYKIAFIAGIIYLGRIASRLAYASYDHSFRIVAWGYGISLLLSLPNRVLSGLILPYASRGGQTVSSSIPDAYRVQHLVYLCVNVTISVTFLILAIVLIVRLHRHLKVEYGSVIRNRAVE